MFPALQEVCRWTRNYYSAMPAETSDQLILHSAVKVEMWGPERAHQSTPSSVQVPLFGRPEAGSRRRLFPPPEMFQALRSSPSNSRRRFLPLHTRAWTLQEV